MMCAHKYAQASEEFEKRNTKLIFIGHGSARAGRHYAENLGMKGRLYLDPERKSHQILSFLDLKWKDLLKFDTKGMKLLKDAFKSGYMIKIRGVGQKTQQGGIAIIGPTKIHYVHRCEKPYDYPEVETVLAQCPTVEQR